MFALARRATKAGKTSLEPAAREELHDRLRHYVTQRPRAGLEALLVGCDILLEVLLERLVENGGFGMPRTVNGRRFASQNARIRCGAMAVLDSNVLQKTRRLGVTATGYFPGGNPARRKTIGDSSDLRVRLGAGFTTKARRREEAPSFLVCGSAPVCSSVFLGGFIFCSLRGISDMSSETPTFRKTNTMARRRDSRF